MAVHFNVFGIIGVVVFVVGGIEWRSLARTPEALGELPRLNDRFDLGNESRNLAKELLVGLGRLQEVDSSPVSSS